MFFESGPWKDELLNIGQFFLRMSKKRSSWTELDNFLVEKNIYVAFFAIRRLLEMQCKLSDYIDNLSVLLVKYPAKTRSTKMDILNKTDIDRFYDLTVTPEKTILPIQLLCNQFVHCYTYANISDTGNNFSGIFFVSDQYKDKHIYSICVKKLCNIFFTIGKDDICSLSSSRNVKTNEMMPMLKLGPYYFDRHCLCFDLIRLIKKIDDVCGTSKKTHELIASAANDIAEDAVDAATIQYFWRKNYKLAATKLRIVHACYKKILDNKNGGLDLGFLNNISVLNQAMYMQAKKEILISCINEEAARSKIEPHILKSAIIITLIEILIKYLQSTVKRENNTFIYSVDDANPRYRESLFDFYRSGLGIG